MQRVEHSGLRVGKEGRTEKNIGIPKRNLSSTKGCGRVVSIGVEVVQNVAARQHSVCEEQRIKEQQYKKSKQSGRWQVAMVAGEDVYSQLAIRNLHFSFLFVRLRMVG